MFIIEDATVTVKWRTAIKVLFLYFYKWLSVGLESLSFLTNLLTFFFKKTEKFGESLLDKTNLGGCWFGEL